MFALASAFLATGVSTGWDNGTFRLFFLLGAVLTVPWLALGTVYLLWGQERGRRVQWGLVFFSGLATGVLFTAPIDGPIHGTAIPVGSEVFGVFPRVLAAVGSGVGAVVIIGGALVVRVALRPRPAAGQRRRAAANVLIALGTLVLSSGGLIQGIAGKDEAFVHHARVRDRRDLRRLPRRVGRRHAPRVPATVGRAPSTPPRPACAASRREP